MQKMIEDIPLMVVVEDKSHQRLMWNNFFKNNFSKLWDESNQTYKTDASISNVFIKQNNEVLDSKVSNNYKSQLLDNNNVLMDVVYKKQPFYDLEGEIIGVITFVISASKITESLNENDFIYECFPELIESISGGFCQFEYFNNGEGQFTYLSPGARSILGLTEQALKQVGLTGCISPTIVDEDRVNIARAFKHACTDMNKIQCDFRYRENERISRCRFIAVKNKHSEIEVNGTSWFGLLLQLEDESLLSDINTELKDVQRTNSIRKGDVWQLCSDDESLLDNLQFNQIYLEINDRSDLVPLVNKHASIIVTKIDFEQVYGSFGWQKLKGFNGKMMIIGAFDKHLTYFSDAIIGLSNQELHSAQVKGIFKDFTCVKKHFSNIPSKTSFNILIAEDNEFNQLLIKSQLAPLGFDITLAGDGKIAYEILIKGDFKAIITDLNMPVVNGLELTSKIRLNPCSSIKNIPIIGLTADSSVETVCSAKKAGIDCVISKPYLLDELYMKLLNLIERVNKVATNVDNTVIGGDLPHWIEAFGSRQDAIAVAKVFYDTLNADLSTLLIAAENKEINKCEVLLHRIKGSIVMVKIDHLRVKIESCEKLISDKKQINNSVFTLIQELLILNRSLKVWLD